VIFNGAAVYATGLVSGAGKPLVEVQVAFRCPRIECHRLFIMRFKRSGKTVGPPTDPDYWELEAVEPKAYISREFAPEITKTSPRFVEIYEQAAKAEAAGLDQLCGPGYRKALEFLVKDYVKTLSENKGKEDEIHSSKLDGCISRYVKDPRVKSCAQRATWLGNDETHYVRKWVDKDLSDLKKLIELTVHWILMDIVTGELEQSMPGKAAVPAG
jgi:hypothetical protein